jgi:hypothetical protein
MKQKHIYMTEERYKLLQQAQDITKESDSKTIETALRFFVNVKRAEQ